MNFTLIPSNQAMPSSGLNTAYLRIDNWNDYSFVTMFYLIVFDEDGTKHDLGSVKIGFKGQKVEQTTHSTLDSTFTNLSDDYFSLGDDVGYYKTIANDLSSLTKEKLLTGLNDIVFNPQIIEDIVDESVFGTSLLRFVSLSAVKGQFQRVLGGGVELTSYDFSFIRPSTDDLAEVLLQFKVEPFSKPKTNIHAIIGRNGVGKTTLLNGMITSVINQDFSKGNFQENNLFGAGKVISNDFFSSIVSVSFSVFDPFDPPSERADPSGGTCYYYIGLKQKSQEVLKSLPQLHLEFYRSLTNCFVDNSKKERWLKAVKTLESDSNFADMNLKILATITSDEYLKKAALHLISKMSSGHAVVILTLTKLVEKVEEKTLLLIDEPESHLHPPLLSAFTRALSDLLSNRNGVAIIATHSPVVLQEIPQSCVSIITRYGKIMSISSPTVETFAENFGILTREVFRLEVTKSGFHALLQSSVDDGGSYQEIFNEYGKKIGIEGQFLLQSMISNRDNGKK
ncbi:AAA family ATPase [Pectobacterium sp. 21LCBS03]|uniref:AAA family ATPase n=1 Tax=Pectobacterium sp. 21LCBS03 TaxID=2935858 RepID=UPI00200E446D|nr:AAA family ATPase [Pectobacterium sp. 21LCBS03]UPY93495.1 ATP-binding protein [Pectobacterium sp. 21LCBS03]